MNHRSLLGNMVPASRIIGEDDLSELIGDLEGDDELADLVAEIGRRRMRRGQRRRANRGLQRMGVSREQLARARAQMQVEQAQMLNEEAIADGTQLTAGRFVADGGQRTLYLPFSGVLQLNAPAGTAGSLVANVQRAMSVRRIILSAVDSSTGVDVGAFLGITSIEVGVFPLFNAKGQSPFNAFAFNAVGNNLETPVAQVGQQVTIDIVRNVLGANPALISGYLIGQSATF